MECLNKNRICSMCKKEFPATEEYFYKNKSSPDGCKSICKLCIKTYDAKHYEENKEYYAEHQVKYREGNREKYNKYKLEYNRKWRDSNRERFLKAHRIQTREYYHKNITKSREYQKEWKRAWAENIKNRLSDSVSSAVYRSAKDNKMGNKWENILGFGVDELMKHLESKFQDGMTWDNYGKWHIDHKIPVSVFNFSQTDHPDFKRCWCLSNLQPLWAKENLSKNNSLTAHFQPMLAMGAGAR